LSGRRFASPAGDREDDRVAVARLLGREPAGPFEVVVRRTDGSPMVIMNAPLLFDGTPMPTRYWLVDRDLREAVSRLESIGGVRQAEAAVDPEALAAAHARYGASRDALLPAGHVGPRPMGGVGGTHQGVKCLHAHLAWWLAGGEDPVGDWTARQLGVARPEEPRRAEQSPGHGTATATTTAARRTVRRRSGEPVYPGPGVQDERGSMSTGNRPSTS